MENVIEIRPVKRDQFKIVVGLAAPSGEGKTLSALKLAYGLAGGDPKKIGFLDTENRRGSQYSNVFGEPFLIGDLAPPFSPQRYIAAMRQFADAGIEALVIDSVSHEWEGEGGCEEIAKNAKKADGTPRKSADWLNAKRLHKQFVNTMLYLPMHIIPCIRAREKADFRNPDKPVSLGIQPICEKNFMFEMSLSFMLSNRGKTRTPLKLSNEFEALVGCDGYLTEDHGRALRDWCGGVDPLEKARNTLRLAASQGGDALKTAWESIGAGNRKILASFKDTLKDMAVAADADGFTPAADTDPEKEWK